MEYDFSKKFCRKRIQEIAESPMRRYEMGIYLNSIMHPQIQNECYIQNRMRNAESIPRHKAKLKGIQNKKYIY